MRVYADLPYAFGAGYDLPPAVAPGPAGLRATDVRLRGAAFDRKLAAVRCHASQVAPLSAHVPRLLARDGVLARERFWAAALVDPPSGVIL